MLRKIAPVALISVLLTPVQATALTTTEAEALTRSIVEEVQTEVVAAAGDPEVFLNLMDRYADMDAISRYVLGAPWRGASEAQRAAFQTAFSEYVAGKYGSQFEDYEGSSIDVLNARDLGRRGIVVETRVNVPSGPPVRVEWQFSDRSGEDRLVDIVAEGVSLLASERAAVGRWLDQRGGDIDDLIVDLPALR
ncbi:MlaC/ttg2D family ABC transporter substrate-binding protein [Pontivivens insulae]|uniref:Putative phospholipid-binding protein MlaC n=1 Tax=Pontivivens insulae TaxID=1639689 RepID=A0A2R8AF16_9RHOB|nr:ABC transporter substrate-binding protein [Pontivivens insulae]RED11942.1 phospholipid transport system substrate-binding protein [Pontivivens insulae]SPF30698.1 putative phospholipid-binding protein MlaC [Pontivivens insulae]